MITYDYKGRIKQISMDDPRNSGHSVCNTCGKDMLKIWDIVCSVCNKTFCYDCAASWDRDPSWYCQRCFDKKYGGLNDV